MSNCHTKILQGIDHVALLLVELLSVSVVLPRKKLPVEKELWSNALWSTRMMLTFQLVVLKKFCLSRRQVHHPQLVDVVVM